MDGWALKKGAGGFSYWHDGPAKLSTSVYPTQMLAEAARDALIAGALATMERRERERGGVAGVFEGRRH